VRANGHALGNVKIISSQGNFSDKDEELLWNLQVQSWKEL
jgi:hypothetical protein